MPVMRQDLSFARDPVRIAAILILVACGGAIAAWIIARGDLVGADARAYWGGVRLWLSGGDPLDPPPPYMPYVYWSWSLPIFTPWAALPWETAWFVYRMISMLLFAWSAAWAYRQHPMATALLVALITIPLAATLDTGNITLLCAMGIWAAHFVGPRWGGLFWALASALKWFPLPLFLILPPRTRLWGLAWLLLFGILTLAVWPEVNRQLELVVNYPRPIRLDYVLLVWAAVPWLWAHPRWFEWRTWGTQLSEDRDIVRGAVTAWWHAPQRVQNLWRGGLRQGRLFLGLDASPPAPDVELTGASSTDGPDDPASTLSPTP
jgi:Glycosyltransferase family 87